MDFRPSFNQYWQTDLQEMDHSQQIDKSYICQSNIPLQQVYFTPIQEVSSIYDSVKTTDFIQVEKDVLLKKNLNQLEQIETSILPITFYKTGQNKSNIGNQTGITYPVVNSVPCSVPLNDCLPLINPPDQKTVYIFSSQENNSKKLLEDPTRQTLFSSKIQLKQGNTRKSHSSIDLQNSLQITTGISGKPYSYAQLITYAIATSSTQKMTLSELYKWCMDNFPYFKEAPTQGWKNSIRHNLSLNRNFIRIPRPINEPGKGSYWTLNKARLKGTIKVSDRSKNSKSHNNPSKPTEFNHIVKLDSKNDTFHECHSQLLYQPPKNTKVETQSFVNSNTEIVSSSPGIQQVLHSYFLQYNPNSNGHPVSMSLSTQPYNPSQYDTTRQTNTRYSLDSAYCIENNKTQEELLSNLLQYQQFKIQQAHKIAIEYDNSTFVDQSSSLQSDFQLCTEGVGNYDNMYFIQDKGQKGYKEQEQSSN